MHPKALRAHQICMKMGAFPSSQNKSLEFLHRTDPKGNTEILHSFWFDACQLCAKKPAQLLRTFISIFTKLSYLKKLGVRQAEEKINDDVSTSTVAFANVENSWFCAQKVFTINVWCSNVEMGSAVIKVRESHLSDSKFFCCSLDVIRLSPSRNVEDVIYVGSC